VYGLFRTTVERWTEDRGSKMAAALAFYTAFAVAPLLLIAIAVAGFVFGEAAARGEVLRQLGDLVGPRGAEVVEELLRRISRPRATLTATLAGLVAILAASTGVFIELQDSLNQIWNVAKRPGRGLLGTVKDRFFSFTMVLGTGFLLLVSLVASALLQGLSSTVAGWAGTGLLMEAANFLVTFGLIAALFSALFRYVPDARTRWRDVWLGGLTTAFLFMLGKTLIGIYLGRSAVSSTYGAAGSFVVFLLWVYYSAHILFFGAELTRVFAEQFGLPPRPEPNAVAVECPPLGAGPRRPPPPVPAARA
jgi:membrane protein